RSPSRGPVDLPQGFAGDGRATSPLEGENADVRRRLDKLEAAVEDLASKVGQQRMSSERIPSAAPEPNETEFTEKHRGSILKIVDEETQRRAREEALRRARDAAIGLAGLLDQPETARKLLKDFGTEFGSRCSAILDGMRNVPKSSWTEEERNRWTQGWRD